ncbi:MAG: hypothetical protein CL760_09060 [Chloroflexi bacterium]|nr:hypothetical protein [Chloroflexota bacterium]
MKKAIERIEQLISERLYWNEKMSKVVSTTNFTLEQENFVEFAKSIRTSERTLNEVLVNLKVVSALRSLQEKIESSESKEQLFIEKIITDAAEPFSVSRKRHELYVKSIEDIRDNLRSKGEWNDDNRASINQAIITTQYSAQLNTQAYVDIETIIDYL